MSQVLFTSLHAPCVLIAKFHCIVIHLSSNTIHKLYVLLCNIMKQISNVMSVRGVRSSHMYYKAGERESPESWTGNWRIESLKVHIMFSFVLTTTITQLNCFIVQNQLDIF